MSGLNPVYVRIKNFQSIEDVELEVRGFTCITGKTNIGKSALIRAVSAALQNSPVVGDVKKGQKFCSVTLRSEGWGFRWEKGEKGGGAYYLDGRDLPLDKIGQGQIDEVVALGFGSVNVGDDKIQPWLAPQWEPVFLLNKSGPAVTDFISEVSRLNVLQDAIIISLRGKKRALDSAKIRTESVEKLRAMGGSFTGLDDLVKVSQELEDQVRSIASYEARIELGEKLHQEILRAHASEAVLAPVTDLTIPQPPDPVLMKRLLSMHQHWMRCEAEAKKIPPLRGILNVAVPVPPSAEMEAFRKVMKHARLPELQKSVTVLEKIGEVEVPRLDEDVSLVRLKLADAHHGQISKSQKALEILSGKLVVPPMPGELSRDLEGPRSRLQRAEDLKSAITSDKFEVASLKEELARTEKELVEVRQKIAAIPSCKTCGRPMAPVKAHGHGKVKTA